MPPYDSSRFKRLAKRKRGQIEKFFQAENRIREKQIQIDSPSARFSLTIDTYSTGPKTWAYSRGVVSRKADGAIIADIKRNYSHFWNCWVQHPNGNEHLLCGEDYQGYTIIDLEHAKRTDYLSESVKNGAGFCWARVNPSPDGKVLAIEGCIWAAPYELVFFDFSDPSHIPLPELGRVADLCKFIKWEDNDVCFAEREIEIRLSDGKCYKDLSESEQDALKPNESGYVQELVRWSRSKRSFI